MSSNRQTEIKITKPWLAAICLVLMMALAGIGGAVLSARLAGLGIDDPPTVIQVLMLAHWAWTVPLALVAGCFLIVGTRRWSKATTAVVTASFFALSLLILITLVAAMFVPIPFTSTSDLIGSQNTTSEGIVAIHSAEPSR